MMATMPTVSKYIGSGPDLLYKKNDAAIDALRAAVEAVRAASPNGRDFLNRPEDDFLAAARAHAEIDEQLRNAVKHFETVLEHVADNS